MSDFFKEVDCDMVSVGSAQAQFNSSSTEDCISLDKANRLLKERGTVVYGSQSALNETIWSTRQTPDDEQYDTHRALLINIEPLIKDSAEKIANDLADYKFDHEVGLRFREFVDRAKALKGNK